MDRHADPEPVRASSASSRSLSVSPAAVDAAFDKAANVDAEDARPAATGKLETRKTDAWPRTSKVARNLSRKRKTFFWAEGGRPSTRSPESLVEKTTSAAL